MGKALEAGDVKLDASLMQDMEDVALGTAPFAYPKDRYRSPKS